MAAFNNDPGKMAPSEKSFFEDPNPPLSFASMEVWNEMRDLLYYAGKPHSHKFRVEPNGDRRPIVRFLDKRAIFFKLSNCMNLIQEDLEIA